MDPIAPLGLIALLFAWTLIKVGYIGAALLASLTWPRATERMLEIYRARPRKCFFIGMVNGVGIPIVSVLLVSTKVLALPGLFVLSVFIALTVVAYGIVYRDYGSRYEYPDTVRHTVAGGLAVESAFYLPVVGQVLSLGFLFRGLGALILTLIKREGGPSGQPVQGN